MNIEVQWNLTYPNIKHPAAQIIWPKYLHILFNAHGSHRAKSYTEVNHGKMLEF